MSFGKIGSYCGRLDLLSQYEKGKCGCRRAHAGRRPGKYDGRDGVVHTKIVLTPRNSELGTEQILT